MTVSLQVPRLTEQQRRIVEWGDGPFVVIAGAGTGKTRVIAQRVRCVLEVKGKTTVDENVDGRPSCSASRAPRLVVTAGPCGGLGQSSGG